MLFRDTHIYTKKGKNTYGKGTYQLQDNCLERETVEG